MTRQPDRRASCLTCGLRCDPDKWTCIRCHSRLIGDLLAELVAQADSR